MKDTATPDLGTVGGDIEAIIGEFDTSPDVAGIDVVIDELVKDGTEDGDAEAAEDKASETKTIDEPEKTGEPEPAYKVTVNGQEVEVPLSELRKGYSREQDYTAKTMALGKERQAVEQLRETAAATEQARYASELKKAIGIFESSDPVLADARKIDWDALKRNDPALFVQYSDQVQARLDLIDQARQAATQSEKDAEQVTQRQQEVEWQRSLDDTAAALVEANPEFSDPDKFQGFVGSVFGYLENQGFAKEEVADLVISAPALILVDKARKYDALEAAKNGLSAKKVVNRSGVAPLKTDGSDARSTSKRLSATAGRDEKVSFVLSEFFKE